MLGGSKVFVWWDPRGKFIHQPAAALTRAAHQRFEACYSNELVDELDTLLSRNLRHPNPP